MTTANGLENLIARESLIKRLQTVPRFQIGSAELKFEPDDLDEFFVNKARKELRETPEVVAEALKSLRKLLEDEPDLVVPAQLDDFLSGFLRPCKWYAESAFELMKRYYKFRQTHPQYCKDLVPSKEPEIFKSGILTPLPLRTADGCRILLIQSGIRWKPREVSLNQIFRGVILSLEAAMAELKTQISGVQVILDMQGLSFSHITQFTPSFAGAVLDWVQRCIPCRVKRVHIVNQPYIFNMLFAIFKPFLQEKLRKRIYFHGTNKSSLLEHIEAKALPDWYGGDLDLPTEPLGDVLWKYFCEFEAEFEASNKMGYVKK